jgi:dihydroflavonol-4-reductase
MTTVSVTGATGFIGGHLCEAFRNAGWRVRAIVRPGNVKPLPPDVDSRPAALAGATRRLADALAGSDVVVHAAGIVRARRDADFDDVNVAGTRAVVEAANTAGARVVLISSQAAVGTGTTARPSQEDDPPHPLTAYGRSKLAAEDVVRHGARHSWTIVRPPAVYGPRDVAFLPVFRMARRGLFLHITDRQFPFTLIHVHDLARAVVIVASHVASPVETFFIGHPDPVTADAMLRHLAHVFGRSYRPWRVPAPLLHAIASAGQLAWTVGMTPAIDRSRFIELGAEGFVCSVERARRMLGFRAAIPFDVGFAETARWYQANGWV